MASHASTILKLFLCACIYNELECDSTCSNMLECTMYNIQQVGRKVDGMQSNMADIVNQLSQIQGALNTTTELEHRLKGVEQENIKLREDLINGTEVLEQKLKAVEEELRMEVLEVEKIKLKDLTNEIQKQNTPFVSFRAFPAKSRTYIGYGKTLLFDYVELNIGHHYIAETSTFICPYNAYYLFTVTVINGDSKIMRAYLRLEGSKLHRVRSDDYYTDDQATIVVVTLCLTGQRVWVETQGSSSSDVYDLYGSSKSSSFSGSVLRTV